VNSDREGWWVYVLLCEGDKLYVGIAKDVDARLAMHSAGRGAFYTRLNRPMRILAREWHPSRSSALKAEYALKQRKTADKWAWTRRLVG
jgi:putative endonuclease